MTNQLKDLMTEAADDLPTYVPDLGVLLHTGRRRVRRRRLVAAAATVAAIAAVIGTSTVTVGT
jgi:hypothetical protein